MNLTQDIINRLNESTLVEKASIDWNNYLTPEEVQHLKDKDDKIEGAEDIIYSKDFRTRYKDFHNKLQAKYKNSWTKRELVQDLADFCYNGHLNESEAEDRKKRFNLWKSQIDKKSVEELQLYLDKLVDKVKNFKDDYDVNLKSPKYYELIDKLDYVEALLGVKVKIGRTLH